jgi:dihydropteroate synthase
MPALRRHFSFAASHLNWVYLRRMLLQCGSHTVDLSSPRVMGVLNVTPDSFSDGGRFTSIAGAVEHALRMAEAGAHFIDVGGESTRPGAAPTTEDEELRRVIPVIEKVAAHSTVLISIDTSKPRVMREAVLAGASLINDVYALRAPDALETAASLSAGVCLMHMRGEPRTMQIDPVYDDVVAEVRAFLEERVQACVKAGIKTNRVLLDPGIGFGKQLQHNLALLAAVAELRVQGRPVLIGVSRKSMFGSLLGRAVDQRLAGGLAVATASVLAGASIVRTHDVAETVDAINVAAALKAAGFHL